MNSRTLACVPSLLFLRSQEVPPLGWQLWRSMAAAEVRVCPVQGTYCLPIITSHVHVDTPLFSYALTPGPVLVSSAQLITTNCLMEPRKSYRDRIYTTNAVGWPGVKILEDMNQLVQHALSMDGFPENDPEPKNITIGFGKNTILSHVSGFLWREFLPLLLQGVGFWW